MAKPTFHRSVLLFILAATLPAAVFADGPVTHEPGYTADGRLTPPEDYRQWVFLSSALDMSYNEKANTSPDPVFDNGFVNPESYRMFLQTGRWPDKTQFALETQGSLAKTVH